MNKKSLWVWLFGISLITVILVNSFNPIQQQPIEQSLGQWFGQVVGILLLPAIYYFLRKPKDTDSTEAIILPRNFVRNIFILTLLVSVANLYVAYQDSNRAQNNAAVWTEESCEFEVGFPKEPKHTHSRLQAESGGDSGDLYGAEVSSEGVFYRSECITAPESLLSNLDEESIYDHMEVIADRMGLSLRIYDHQLLEGYLVGIITGEKSIDGDQNMLEVRNIIGKTSVLTLYVMSSPEKFKSIDARNFIESPKVKSL